MEEKILEIIRTGRNFTQMAEDIATHLKEFIEWVGGDYTPCVLLYDDDGEKDYWIVYKDGTAEILIKFKTTNELYEYWLNNIKTVKSTCNDTKYQI